MTTWTALPGKRLAYGDSGFEIEMCTNPTQNQYTLFDPENRILGSTNMLAHLKTFAEERAAERAEFTVLPENNQGLRL